jgi:hypothetical protein
MNLTLSSSRHLPRQCPATIRALGLAQGQLTVGNSSTATRLQCKPVRDLLVDYLKQRQPALDYASLDSVSQSLADLLWARIEALSPGIATLPLPPEVAHEAIGSLALGDIRCSSGGWQLPGTR